MFEAFEKYLGKHTAISVQELELIRSGSVERTMRKWQPILQDGEIWRINCFIAAGC
jgi:hypothetical protein